MFCPKCGVHNLEDAKFCRACGADIRLVPQALEGSLPESAYGVVEVEEREGKGRKYKFKKPPTLEKGLENIFCGVAFLIIFLLGLFYYSGGFLLWVWLIIPALAGIGEGLGQVIRSRREQPALPTRQDFNPAAVLPATPRELPAADTNEIKSPPSSVTENTTRQLGARVGRARRDA